MAFYVPAVGEWQIAINGVNKVDGADLDSLVGAECARLVISLYADGAPSVACGHELYTGVLRVSPPSKGFG